MPSRILSPRISTTVMTMSLLMTILSFFFLDRASMAVYPSEVLDLGWEGRGQELPSWAGAVGRYPTFHIPTKGCLTTAVREPGGAIQFARRTEPICPR